jgi:sterol desaturase/sphingolipid hydroxylase (fatty acid hydroxylase superfamily)
VGFLLRSLIAWGTHLAMHKIPILWRVHRVHHTDSVLDVSTTVRFHPLEFLIATPVLLTGILLTGIPPVALMAYEILDAAMAVFTHANVRIPASTDRWLRYVLVTPDMHRIHHSTRRPETDSNYGATLSLWDHLVRTHRAKAPQELASQTLGLDGVPPSRETSLGWLLLLPWRRDAT